MFKYWFRGFKVANSIWMLFIFMCMIRTTVRESERADKLQEKVDRLTANPYDRYKNYIKHSPIMSKRIK